MRAQHVSLFRLGDLERPLEEIVLEQDVVYVGGGSMRNLLAIWSAHGLDELLTRAWRRGTVLAGISAGAMCWFEGGVTCSSGAPEPIDGLGLLKGSLTVHADGEPERLPVWLKSVRVGTLPGGWAPTTASACCFAVERPGACGQLAPGRRRATGGRDRWRAGAPPPGLELLGAGEPAIQPLLDDGVRELRRVNRCVAAPRAGAADRESAAFDP